MSPRPPHLLRLLPLLALALAATAGCGSGPGSTAGSGTGGTSGGPTSTPAGSPTSEPLDPSLPTSPGSPREQTVTGVVSAGVEGRCLVLTPEPSGTGGTWVLVGDTASLAAGQRVTLRGLQMTGMATTCNQGRPFHVVAVVSTSG